MKKYIKITLYVIGILAVAFVIDRLIGMPIENFLLPKQNDKYMYAYRGGKGEEIVILGASRASHHYIPKIIEDSLGVKCFNYGCDGQNIYNQYAVLNLILNHTEKKPRLVILELSSIDILNMTTWNTEKLSALHSYYSLDDSLKNVVSLQGDETSYALESSKLYSFNSNIHNLIKPILGINNNDVVNSGFVPLYRKWGKQIESKPEDDKEIDLSKITYLNKFIERCKNDSIKILFLNSPNYVNLEGGSKWKPVIEKIAGDNNITFIDFEQDPFFLKRPELFNEPFHLNVEGATLYTKGLLPLISRYFQ